MSDPTAIEPITGGPWNFWLVVIVATLGNTSGSLIAYGIGAWGGRPFLERYGKYILIRPHEIELAERFFDKCGAATAFFSRLLPIVRTFISFPAGVARMPICASSSSTRRPARSSGRSCSCTRATVLGASWADIRHALQPFDMAIAVAVVLLGAVAFIWWRLGMPGRRRPSTP